MESMVIQLSDDKIINKIYLVRGKKVMLDIDLANLYGVETGQLKRQVRRNTERFPDDFMFELTRAEYNSLRSQIGNLKRGGHVKYLPFVFTEQGVAMLSSVLNSEQAIAVNIQIIRVFSRIREMLISHKDILLKLETIEKKLLSHDHHLKKHEDEIQLIFNALKQLLNTPNHPRTAIGYKQN